jgi:predicted dinucleotide-binding enzyme
MVQSRSDDMKIGLVGAGQIGGALARRLTALGHQVLLSNSRGPKTLADLAAEAGATAVARGDAVRELESRRPRNPP